MNVNIAAAWNGAAGTKGGRPVGRSYSSRRVAILPPVEGRTHMQFADLCVFLAVLFAFATLVLKVVEVARRE
jgi:hypothetical protein